MKEAGSKMKEMEVSLRDFQKQDFETLWAIDQKCFPPGISYSRLELATYIRKKEAFSLIAESPVARSRPSFKSAYAKASNILGFIVAEASLRGTGHIITIDVLPEARRSGLGSRLLNAAEARLRQESCTSVILEAAVDNGTALAFYQRHGYSVSRRLIHYYPNGVDAFVLQKDLLSPALAS
jgi:ribosomal-protein-alanine N-acetyltransferase